MDIGMLISLIGVVCSIAAGILAAYALKFSKLTFNESIRLATYDALDRMYLDHLRVAIDKPHLRDKGAVRNVEEQREYEIYAHMAWCIVETIYDHAVKDVLLFDVWSSAMEIENGLHREWFDKRENEFKFRKEFREWVKNWDNLKFEAEPQQSTQTLMP